MSIARLDQALNRPHSILEPGAVLEKVLGADQIALDADVGFISLVSTFRHSSERSTTMVDPLGSWGGLEGGGEPGRSGGRASREAG